MVLRPLFAAALVVRRSYFIVAPRPFPAAPLVVRRRCLTVLPRPIPAEPRRHLIVGPRLLPVAPLCVAETWSCCPGRFPRRRAGP